MAEFQVVKVPRTQARDHLAKAQQFAAAARSALDLEQRDAALLNAVHAAITAADAATVVLAGERSADADHLRAADLLEHVARAADEARTKAGQLRALIKKKNVVEYEARRATVKEARDAVERAGRIVEWVQTIVERARP